MSAPASEMAANPCATGHFGGCTIPCRDPHLVLCKPGRLCYTLPAREHLFRLFLGSSAVEHSTVNRMVAGSNPARGAKLALYPSPIAPRSPKLQGDRTSRSRRWAFRPRPVPQEGLLYSASIRLPGSADRHASHSHVSNVARQALAG